MDEDIAELLDELRRHGAEHDSAETDRLQRLRNVEPDTARLLAVLVRAVAAREVLEIGTSNGYSTVWLADAVEATDGRLVSIEIDAERSAQADRNLARAGLRPRVELRVEDAAEALRRSRDDRWDMIFLDAERPAYAGYWPDLRRALRPGGLLVVDNVVSHAEQVREFRDRVTATPGFTESLVPTGAGALLIVRDLPR